MNISNNMNVYNMFNAMSQGSMALNASRLSRNLFTNNNAQGQGAPLGSEGVRFVNHIRTASDSLSSVLRELSSPASSNRIVAMSANPSSVSIKHTGSRPIGVSSMTVRIDQIAAGQANEGNRMDANASFEGETGANRFAIEAGGRTTQISVNVREGDTNRDVQQRMADAINNAGAGVRATVELNTETNTSMLRLESTTTGSGPGSSFSISDTAGDLVARAGVGDATREGQDAIFRVNDGPARRSQSNTVFLGSGVTATFNSASEEATRITWGQDSRVTRSSVEDMVRSYNELFSTATTRTNDPRSQNLASRMLGISRTFSGSLSSIGIGFDASGRMTMDTARMNQAEESGRLGQFFTENRGRNFGFANQLGRLADSVTRNPGNFVSGSLFRSDLMGNFGYTNLGNPTQFNFFSPGSAIDFIL